MPQSLLLGNEAMALGLHEAGCEVATAYPGTPSTEILESFLGRPEAERGVVGEWSVNEKVALDVALAASLTGKRAAACMKQVGLNVASDSLLSAAYTGVVGGLVLIVCDDPGPHSSQTEQDTRLFGLFAKVPVLDPATPREARAMVREAFALSERRRVPVVVRPTTRVCHTRQPIAPEPVETVRRPAKFAKDPERWAATPRFRLELHRALNEKLEAIRAEFASSVFNGESGPGGRAPLGIVAGGAAWATARDVLDQEGLETPLLKIGTPFPLPVDLVMDFVGRHERTIVLEEPDAAIEIQIPDRRSVRGRLNGFVPSHGELTPEIVARIVTGRDSPAAGAPGPRPTLCPGCGHRAAFFAIRKAMPRAIFAGDIGCYTLGVNQSALDTCLDMGASITMALGFWHAHRLDGQDVPVVAEIGDSTFFHSGIPALLQAVASGARIVVVVFDNGTVAMTGGQPTPAERGADIERIARAVGVRFVETIDPYEVEGAVALMKRARDFTRSPDGGVAVVIARRPCVLAKPLEDRVPVEVDEAACTGCEYCLRFCECPALVQDRTTGKVHVDHARCVDCGMCIPMCQLGAIVPRKEAVRA